MSEDQIPVLSQQNNHHHHQQQENEILSSDLNNCLQNLDIYMLLLGFNQSSVLGSGITWVTFIIIGVAVPVGVLLMPNCLKCDLYQVQGFELPVVVSSHASLAASALLCLSHNLRKYGIRKFLFVDQYNGHVQRFSTQYVNKISVSSIAQVVGVILCLNAAAKISHRAQGLASLASRWHALASCGADDMSQMRCSSINGTFEAATTLSRSVSLESDMEAMSYIPLPKNAQLTSYLSSYHRRQAFLMYLQNNPGGITLYGWTVDRSLINTIFFIELSLVLFVLGRTTVFTTTN